MRQSRRSGRGSSNGGSTETRQQQRWQSEESAWTFPGGRGKEIKGVGEVPEKENRCRWSEQGEEEWKKKEEEAAKERERKQERAHEEENWRRREERERTATEERGTTQRATVVGFGKYCGRACEWVYLRTVNGLARIV